MVCGPSGTLVESHVTLYGGEAAKMGPSMLKSTHSTEALTTRGYRHVAGDRAHVRRRVTVSAGVWLAF